MTGICSVICLDVRQRKAKLQSTACAQHQSLAGADDPQRLLAKYSKYPRYVFFMLSRSITFGIVYTKNGLDLG